MSTEFNNLLAVNLISDIKLSIVMDAGVRGTYTMTPELHSHKYYELQMSISGEFRVDLLNGKSITMTQDTICLIPPNCYHSTVAVSEHPKKLALRFSYSHLPEAQDHKPIYDSFNATLRKIADPIVCHSSEICRLILEIRKELNEKQMASDVMVDALMRQLFVNLIRELITDSSHEKHESYSDDEKNTRYYKIEIYFDTHYSQKITESDLAEEMSLSKRQVSRLLRELFGMSFREKLIDIRLHKALKLLTNTDISVERIIELVGYSSLSGFYSAFIKRFGMCASEYRKRFRI